MKLISISLARVAAFIEVQSWDPFGRTSGLEAFHQFGKRYSFQVVPQNIADVDFQKGIELSAGKLGEINIDKITVYFNGIAIDTRSSTDHSEAVLADILNLTREAFGAVATPQRRYFTSQVVFHSDLRLANLNPVLHRIAGELSTSVSSDMKHSYAFEPTGIFLSPDLSQTKIFPGHFSLERRAEIPFVEETYFSSAPLRTQAHLDLLRNIEQAIPA